MVVVIRSDIPGRDPIASDARGFAEDDREVRERTVI